MTKDEIFQIIKENIIEIIPELSDRKIHPEDSLKMLGANSVDRAEILIKSMASLKVKAPLIEFAQAKNINDLSEILAKYVNLTSG